MTIQSTMTAVVVMSSWPGRGVYLAVMRPPLMRVSTAVPPHAGVHQRTDGPDLEDRDVEHVATRNKMTQYPNEEHELVQDAVVREHDVQQPGESGTRSRTSLRKPAC